MNLIPSHGQACVLHIVGWMDDKADAAVVMRAQQRQHQQPRLAVFSQTAFPGSQALRCGDAVGTTGEGRPPTAAAPTPGLIWATRQIRRCALVLGA
jgi:hypothetical protein